MDGFADAGPQRVVRSIQEQIRRGAFALGERLPSQRDLAEELRVSRASLREALSTLEALGVLRTEARRGTVVVGDPDRASIVPWRYASRASLTDFFQFRLVNEGYAARLAAMRGGPELGTSLTTNVSAMRTALLGEDLVGAADLDASFHRMVMAASGNRVFLDLYSSYGAMMQQSLTLPLANGARLWEPIVEHENVVRAIVQRDPDGAGYFMRLHIVRAAERSGVTLHDPV